MTGPFQRSEGFALVGALFVLVVLGGLGAMMVNLSAVQHSTVSMAVQGSRAFQASRAGLEWAAARAMAGQCASTSSFTLEGFDLSVSCVQQVMTENALSYNVFTLRSTATTGVYGQPNYVSRRTEMRVTDAL